MSNLSEEAKQERAAYMREWRAKNPQKTKQMNRKYWEKRAARKEKKQDAEANDATK